MKTFKEFITEHSNSNNEVACFANAGGSQGQYDKFPIEESVGFANAGGSQGQYNNFPDSNPIVENLNPKDNKPIVVHSKSTIFQDPDKSNSELGEEPHQPENLNVPDEHGNGFVVPENNKEHAKHIIGLNDAVKPTEMYYDNTDAYTSNSNNLNHTLWEHHKKGTTPPNQIAANLDNSISEPEENPQIQLDHLDYLINSHKTPHAMTVYTGLHLDPTEHRGKILITPAYTSAAANPHVAKDFGKKFSYIDGEGNTHYVKHMLRIELPKGHPHLFTDAGSHYSGQGEVILPRNMRLQVGSHPTHVIHGNFNSHFTGDTYPTNHTTHLIWNARILPKK